MGFSYPASGAVCMIPGGLFPDCGATAAAATAAAAAAAEPQEQKVMHRHADSLSLSLSLSLSFQIDVIQFGCCASAMPGKERRVHQASKPEEKDAASLSIPNARVPPAPPSPPTPMNEFGFVIEWRIRIQLSSVPSREN